MNSDALQKPAPTFSLRRETPGDQPFLFDLYASTRQDELVAAGLPPAAWRGFLELQFRAMCAAYSQAFAAADWWIVIRDGAPVGRIIVHRTAEEHRIVDLALLPPHRGQAIGTRLIQDVQQAAAAAGLPVRLQVFQQGRANQLYRRLGFVEGAENGLRILMEWRPAGER